MHPRRLLLWLAVATVAVGPSRLAAQRDTRDYSPHFDYSAMHDRIRERVDRALERSGRAVERSTRLSEHAAERAPSRAAHAHAHA